MNTSIFNFLNGLAVKYTALDSFFIFLANNFGFVIILGLAYYILVHDSKKQALQELVLILVVAILAWFVAHFLKDLFRLDRPFITLTDSLNLFPEETGHAFPSGHATFYSALATMMWFYHKRIGLALGVVALIIGSSRIITGVHWPIDVVGGYLTGVIIAYFSYLVWVRLARKFNLR